MICPYCGRIEKGIPPPELVRTFTRLGTCKCGKEVWAIPTQRRSESSPLGTVEEGEKREEILVATYTKHEGGATSKRRPSADDIDREVYDDKGSLVYFLEIKERSNSLNGYFYTQFPYAKIESGKKLTLETGLPVFIVLKFLDCWARHEIRPELEYIKGDRPFAPRYRPWQRSSIRQIPVLIAVESLEILPWHDFCVEINQSL
jgi:hypothetical protein